MMELTTKQERFALNLFKGMYQRDAYIDAYHANYAFSTIDSNASRLANSAKVLARLSELRQKAEDASVMNVLERKQKLSEIARTKLTDFMELGQDGSWVNIGKETPNAGSIQEIHSRTEYDDEGSHPTVYTSVKLHDPIKAIDLLNKLDRIYDTEKTQINIFNISAKDLSDDELASIASRGSRRIAKPKAISFPSD